MPIGTQKLPLVGGGYDAMTDPLALELLMSKTGSVRSPDCLNVFGQGESVETRCGCFPWYDTGLTGKVYFFSDFHPPLQVFCPAFLAGQNNVEKCHPFKGI